MSDAPVLETRPSGDFLGTGRRKTAIARVRLRPGQGKVTINGRPLEVYFANERQQRTALAPLIQAGKREAMDVIIRVSGGGSAGQADACKMGVARALKRMEPELDKMLRDAKFLTRDSRMKERKKYGFRGARRGTQFSKR